MSDATETPVPAPSEGMLARLATKFGIRSESEIVAEMKAESAAILQAGNEAQAELDTAKADLLVVKTERALLQAKLNAVDAALPGLSASADPKAFFIAAVAAQAQEQISASGCKPGEAPAVDGADRSDGTMTRAEFNNLTASQQSEFSIKGGILT